jgi:hypothetical protein
MNKLVLLLLVLPLSIHAQDSTAQIINSSPIENTVPLPLPIEPQKTTLQKEEVVTGSLHILTNSPDAKIYLDGKEAGVSGCLLTNIPVGQHEIFILDGDNSYSTSAYVIEGITRTIKANPGRETFVNVMSTFSNVWCRRIRAFGPSLDIGIQHNESYYGINFHWAFFNYGNNFVDAQGRRHEESAEFVGGAGLQWYYTVYKYNDFLEVAPGLASGFWSFYGSNYISGSNSGYEGNSFNEMFFTGPSLRVSTGFKRFFLTGAYTLLIGTRLGHALVFGTRVVL